MISIANRTLELEKRILKSIRIGKVSQPFDIEHHGFTQNFGQFTQNAMIVTKIRIHFTQKYAILTHFNVKVTQT